MFVKYGYQLCIPVKVRQTPAGRSCWTRANTIHPKPWQRRWAFTPHTSGVFCALPCSLRWSWIPSLRVKPHGHYRSQNSIPPYPIRGKSKWNFSECCKRTFYINKKKPSGFKTDTKVSPLGSPRSPSPVRRCSIRVEPNRMGVRCRVISSCHRKAAPGRHLNTH